PGRPPNVKLIVTLLTDFGASDFYVAAMKGVILSRDPSLRIVDLSHEVPRHDVEAAAFLLLAVYAEFPDEAVHIAVVDPGVGSARLPIVVRAGSRRLVGPDNGTFSYILDREGSAVARAITAPELVRASVGATFHGRDIFAPAGAALAGGFPFESVGPTVAAPVRLRSIDNTRGPDGRIRGRILHVDHFGNCVTSFTPEDVGPRMDGYHLRGRASTVTALRGFYAEAAADEAFAIWGSTGYLEIALNQGSAAAHLGLRRGDEVYAER
ncbi:MAG: SAM-dependent chlorinase/fluorinase, partial [Gemmatimonadota bacterium]